MNRVFKVPETDIVISVESSQNLTNKELRSLFSRLVKSKSLEDETTLWVWSTTHQVAVELPVAEDSNYVHVGEYTMHEDVLEGALENGTPIYTIVEDKFGNPRKSNNFILIAKTKEDLKKLVIDLMFQD